MRHNPKNRASEKGFILIYVGLVLVLAGLILPPLLGFVFGSLRSSRIRIESMDRFYAADAGWEAAFHQIQTELPEPGDGTIYISLEDMNGCDVDVAVDTFADATYRITSTSTDFDGLTHTIVSHVQYLPESLGYPLFDHAIAADGNITLSRDNTVEGNLHANAEILMSQGTQVLGNATAVGTITGGTVTQNRIEAGSPIEWPPGIETEGFKDEAMADYHFGDYTVGKGPGVIDLGPLYVTGNLRIGRDNTVNIDGAVYVEGSITFGQRTILTGTGAVIAELDIDLNQVLNSDESDHLFIMSTTGSIRVHQEIEGRGLIYAPNGDIEIHQEAVFSGALVGANVSIDKESSITYERIADIWDELPGASSGQLVVVDYIIVE